MRGRGTSTANRPRNSTGSNTRAVVPSRHGCRSASRTCPSPVRWSRSLGHSRPQRIADDTLWNIGHVNPGEHVNHCAIDEIEHASRRRGDPRAESRSPRCQIHRWPAQHFLHPLLFSACVAGRSTSKTLTWASSSWHRYSKRPPCAGSQVVPYSTLSAGAFGAYAREGRRPTPPLSRTARHREPTPTYYDEGDARQHNCRQLAAERLARFRQHHGKHVEVIEHRADHLLLAWGGTTGVRSALEGVRSHRPWAGPDDRPRL